MITAEDLQTQKITLPTAEPADQCEATNTTARCRNGLAHLQQWLCYLQEPGLEPHLQSVEFFACKKVSPLNNRIPTLPSVPSAPII